MNTQEKSYLFNNLRNTQRGRLQSFFDSIHLSDEGNKFSHFKSTSPIHSLMGRVLIALWLLEALFSALFFQIQRTDYFLISLYILVVLSFIYVISLEGFVSRWIKKEHPQISQKSRESFLMLNFFPLYLGPVWLLLTPFFIFKNILDPDQMKLSLFVVSSFIIAWMTLIIFAQQKVSNPFLEALPQKIENQRSMLVLYFFLLFLIVGCCVLFHLVTTFPVKDLLLSRASTPTAGKYHVFFNEVITSNGLSIMAVLLLSLIRQITIGYKNTTKLYFKCGIVFALVLLHIAGMMRITPGGLEMSFWPLTFLSSSSFFHRLIHKLPLNLNNLDTAFTAHAALLPLIWVGSMWLWEGLQQRKPNIEAWFRVLFIPLSFAHLPLLLYPLINLEKLGHISLATLGAMGGFAFTFRSYIGGIVLCCTQPFCEGDYINMHDEKIEGAQVVRIDFMNTRVRLKENGRIRIIPNEKFLASTVEKISQQEARENMHPSLNKRIHMPPLAKHRHG